MNWESSSLWGIIGVLFGLLSSGLFYLIGKKDKKIQYEIKSTQLITDKLSKINGLSITFAGNLVPNLVSTDIVIFNNGSDIIESSDFALADPLSFHVEDGVFMVYGSLNDFIIKVDKLTNLSLESMSDVRIRMNFDYMKKGAIVKLNVIHSGSTLLHGTLKKGKIIRGFKTRNLDILLIEMRLLTSMFIVFYSL